MKLRIIGTESEFQQLNVDTLDKNKFETFRKPQKGNNPKYKDKPQLLMYVELSTVSVNKILSSLRK